METIDEVWRRIGAAEHALLIAEDAIEVVAKQLATMEDDYPDELDESPSAEHSPSATHSATGRAASAIGEPDLLDEDARGPKDDGDPDGSWSDLAQRAADGVYNDGER
ncbi:hypothetical protein LCGC14_1875210 [marine sediment metagenome]|uniref:Uncharacterized protein n=1 Tax=marine sediment metagenome TaxID=412755 RepID=A0A0F9IHU3_9ZZZZ